MTTCAPPLNENCLARDHEVLDIHLTWLTGYIPPHALPVFVALARRVRKLTLLLSTTMESNRYWEPDWGALDVRLQRTTTLVRRWRHTAGFSDRVEVHLPWDTRRQLKELAPDVVASDELGCRSLLSALYCRGTAGPPLVLCVCVSEHTEQGRGWHRHVLRRWLARRADCVAVNGSSAARYMARIGVPRQRMVVAPYTAEPSALYHGPVARDTPRAHHLLFVGQLIERKGILPFTQALIRWSAAQGRRRVDFTVAGTGPLLAALQALSTPENLTIHWRGNCDFSQVQQCYRHAGIFVFPTLADEWGLVVNEAMHAGLPVLGSEYAQAVEELCVDGRTGWTYRPDAEGQLERGLDRAFACSPEELNTMRVAARERVAPITPEYAAGQLVQAIREAQRNRGTTAAR